MSTSQYAFDHKNRNTYAIMVLNQVILPRDLIVQTIRQLTRMEAFERNHKKYSEPSQMKARTYALQCMQMWF